MAMRFGRTSGAWAVLALGLAAHGSAMAQEPPKGDAERGKALSYTCLGCHGIPNYKNAYPNYSVPKLGGQHHEYIVVALQAYRSGERSHATMHSQSASLTDQDMADIAAFFAGEPLKSNGKAEGTPPEKAQTCVACHGEDGIGIVPQYPTLSGQHADYLARALTDYKRGGRKNAIMAGFAGTLTAADIKALAEYYAKQRPPLTTVDKDVFQASTSR